MNKIDYSVIVPVFNEEGNLNHLYDRLAKVMGPVTSDYEIIFIDDNSKDKSYNVLLSLNKKDQRVKIIKFSRNFGHQAAITAGLDFAKGDAVIMMDADLQDPPEVIVQFIEKYKEGYDVVYGQREERKGESAFKLMTASLFYRLMNLLTDIEIPLDTGDFRLIDRKVVDSLKGMQERNRFLRGLITWVGYKQIGIGYKRDARYKGKSNYPFMKMLKFAIDGISSFSHLPLRFATFTGFIVSFITFWVAIWAIYLRISGIAVSGWTSLMVSVLFLGGVQLLAIGIIGEYLGRIYDEVKNRPIYLLNEKIGIEK